jgi:hypothetical protein
MKRWAKVFTADRLNRLNFHDDSFVSLRIHPPRNQNNLSRIEFGFKDDSTGSAKVLSFRTCANFRLVMDFDVLADNWHFGNTKTSVAHADISRMKKFVNAMKSHWRTTYMPPVSKNKPIRRKLRAIRSYVLFKVAFFGGTAEILAKSFRLKN